MPRRDVSLAIAARTEFVVMGGKGTTQNAKFTEHGSTLISEGDFLGMVLTQNDPTKRISLHLSHTR